MAARWRVCKEMDVVQSWTDMSVEVFEGRRLQRPSPPPHAPALRAQRTVEVGVVVKTTSWAAVSSTLAPSAAVSSIQLSSCEGLGSHCS
ncbi:unnamed protein product [Arctogadus glacialis]